MRHFQFAGAPDVRTHVVEASELALAYFQACARDSKGHDSLAWLKIRRLLHGLLLCALAKRWDAFEKVCDCIQPKLAGADATDTDDDDYAQVLLVFVSSSRHQPLAKAAALEQAVQKRRARRPRLLLDVCRAIAAGREADFAEALRSSLEDFVKQRPEEGIIRSGSNQPFQYVALPESLFHLAALNRGIKLSALPQQLADLLITPKSIGASRK